MNEDRYETYNVAISCSRELGLSVAMHQVYSSMARKRIHSSQFLNI